VKVPIRDAAANTVIDDVDADAELPAAGVVDELPEVPLEQPAAATAASTAAITVKRRIMCSCVVSGCSEISCS
jgi:hypothetical protein